MQRLFIACLALLSATSAEAQLSRQPDETTFRSIYRELIETRTTYPDGGCTAAADKMAVRLKAAGFPERDLHMIFPEGRPNEGNLVAVLPGREPEAKAVLMLAHLDVVEAKREDWERDPFTLVEEGGYFYARGARDDKAQAAIWVDNMVRFKREGYRPRRTIKLALTCGEETGGFINGAQWLATRNRELIDAGVALNEGGYGELDASGRKVSHLIVAAEKAHVMYILEATNPGGHSSQPVPDNAIYHVIGAVERISGHAFPIVLNEANRTYFTRMGGIVGGSTGAAMRAIVANPNDEQANATLSANPTYNAMLRTTCVATMMQAGHAPNALPQRATATLSCRLMPGTSPDQVYQALAKLTNDPAVKITIQSRNRPDLAPPAMTPEVLGPLEKTSEAMWPGVPLVPMQFPSATDAPFLNAAGIPTFGITGMFVDPDGGRMHGLNERIRVRSLIEAREFLYRLVKAYGNQTGR